MKKWEALTYFSITVGAMLLVQTVWTFGVVPRTTEYTGGFSINNIDIEDDNLCLASVTAWSDPRDEYRFDVYFWGLNENHEINMGKKKVGEETVTLTKKPQSISIFFDYYLNRKNTSELQVVIELISPKGKIIAKNAEWINL